MTVIISLLFSLLAVTDRQASQVNSAAGLALVTCARLGAPPECIHAVFGRPEFSFSGCLDWDQPDRHIILEDYRRFGVYVQWAGSPFASTGKGPGIVVHGSIEP